MTSASGAVLWLADYDAFGRAQVQEAMITNPQRFPGQYYDGESGLHYNWHRYYDPGTGRYISSDPIGLAAGVNAYAYVNGNPLLFFDPYGLEIYGYWMTKPFPEIYDVKIPLGEARRPDDWWKFWKHGFAYKAMEHRVDVHVGFQWAVQCKEAEGCRQDGWVVDGGTADWIGVYVPIATPAISRIGKYISLTNITYNLLIKPATSRGVSDSSR